MIGLERLLPGTGSHAVVAHLVDVYTDARRALVRAEPHLEFLAANLALWAELAAGDLRARLDKAGPDLAVAQFARPIAPQSRTGLTTGAARPVIAALREHRWLEPVPGPGGLYRAHRGDVYGLTNRRTA